MLKPIHRHLLKWRLWFVEYFHGGELPVTLFWAGLVGLGGGLLSVLFRRAIRLLQWVLTEHQGSLVQTAMDLPKWERLLVPGVGGLIAGVVLVWGMRLARSRKTSDYMEALVVGNGVVGVRTTLVKSLSSLFTIASGGAVGREGPMVTLASMLASTIGRLRGFSMPRLKLLVACGAAAGIAAAYNAPIAGALYVGEIILGTISMEMFGPLIFSSVVSTLTVHQLLGARPTYVIPGFHVASNWEFFFYIALGLLAGMISPLFLGLLKNSERLLMRLPVSVPVRMMAGGLIVGVISLICPEVWGNGYSVVNSILRQDWIWTTLLMVFACKILATGATVGSGAVGGVFTPTLFVGASIGCLFGHAIHFVAPQITTVPGGYALVGMGCFLAATTQAPLMSILMIFEMTLQYDVVLPLMLGCVTAHYMSKGLGQKSIYASHLRRKKVSESSPGSSKASVVRDLMRPDPPCVLPQTSFGEIARIFSKYRINYVYVVDAEKRFLGVVSLHEMKPYLNDPVLSETVLAMDFMREDFPVLASGQHLTEALKAFSSHDGERIPIVDNLVDRHLVGVISKTDLLLALADFSSRPASTKS
jgi:chloride channel protein, CIC family